MTHILLLARDNIGSVFHSRERGNFFPLSFEKNYLFYCASKSCICDLNLSFEKLLEERIFIPNKMGNTTISKANLKLDEIAIGQNTNGIRMPMRVEKDMNAEGGIISNTSDMIKYMEYHLDENRQVIAVSHQHLWDGNYGDFEAGLFWQINKNGDEPDRIFQNGGAFGTSSWITLIPDENIGVFIVTNVSGQNIHQKLSETVDKIISEIESHRL